MKHRPLDDLTEVFEAMKKAAKPGDCELCKKSGVPTIQINRVGNEADTKTVCLDCMMGKTKAKLTDQLN